MRTTLGATRATAALMACSSRSVSSWAKTMDATRIAKPASEWTSARWGNGISISRFPFPISLLLPTQTYLHQLLSPLDREPHLIEPVDERQFVDQRLARRHDPPVHEQHQVVGPQTSVRG